MIWWFDDDLTMFNIPDAQTLCRWFSLFRIFTTSEFIWVHDIHEALCALLPNDALRSHGVLCLPDHVCKLSGALFVEEIRRICDRVLAWSHRFPQFHMHRNVAKNVQSIPVLCELFPGPANYFDDPYHVSRLVLTSEILHCLLHRHGHHQLGR